jgi:nucleotide-binding universal stress UspA family protein
MYKRILVPTDGSDVSALAVKDAIEFARACGSEIVALSVAEPYPINPAAEGAMVSGQGTEIKRLMDQAEQNVRQVAIATKAAGVECATTTALSFYPSDEIMAAIKRTGCDLVFMGSHGRRGLSRLLAGSETQNVLAYSPVPVMVLRPQSVGSGDLDEHAGAEDTAMAAGDGRGQA